MQTNVTAYLNIPEWQLDQFPPLPSANSIQQPIDGNILRQQNDLNGLRWVLDFKWLRPVDLGLLLWPTSTDGTRRAYKVIREWTKKQWVLERHHQELGCKVVVLTQGGANLLKQNAIGYATSNSDWGRITNGIWRPAKDWRHDLICTRLALFLLHRGYAIKTERQVRAEYARQKPDKWPDLLAMDPTIEATYWIEVESSRKTGKNMDSLAGTLVSLSEGDGDSLLNLNALPAVAFIEDSRDIQTGHRINHLLRIKRAVRQRAQSTAWLTCFRLDQTLMSFDHKEIQIDPAWLVQNLRAMAHRSWQEHPSFPPGARCVENYPFGRGQHQKRHVIGYWEAIDKGKKVWAWKQVSQTAAYTDQCSPMRSGSIDRLESIRRFIAQNLWISETDA